MKRMYGALAVAAVALMATPALAQIKIGSAGPMTGSDAAFGEQMKRGAEMAVADINAKGGVLGKKLDLIVYNPAETMESDGVTATLIYATGQTISLPSSAKSAFSRELIAHAIALFATSTPG